MARHRNIRKLDYSEEYGYDEVFGRSLEEDVAVSPSTAAEFMYQRDSRDNPSLNSYWQHRDDPHGTPRSEDKSTTKSPLAVTSCSATTTAADIGPPPGFLPKTRVENLQQDLNIGSWDVAMGREYAREGSLGLNSSSLSGITGEESCRSVASPLSELIKNSKSNACQTVELKLAESRCNYHSSQPPPSSKQSSLSVLMRESHSKPASFPSTCPLPEDTAQVKPSSLSDLFMASQSRGSTRKLTSMISEQAVAEENSDISSRDAITTSSVPDSITMGKGSLSELMKKSKSRTGNILLQTTEQEKPLCLGGMMKQFRSDCSTAKVKSDQTNRSSPDLGNLPEKKSVQRKENRNIEELEMRAKLSELMKIEVQEAAASEVRLHESKTRPPSLSELMKMSQSNQTVLKPLEVTKRELVSSSAVSQPATLSLSDLIKQSQSASPSSAERQHKSVPQSTSSLKDLIRESKRNKKTEFQDVREPDCSERKRKLVKVEQVVSDLSGTSMPERSLSEIASYHLSRHGQGASGQLSAMMPSLEQLSLSSGVSLERKEIIFVQHGSGLSLFGRCMKKTFEISPRMHKVHNRVHHKLNHQYQAEFLQTFNFSSPSPDDVVQEKQGLVFK